MDMAKYMTFEVDWRENLGTSEDTLMIKYGEPVKSKCFTYGKNMFIRDSGESIVASARVYLTLDNVKPGDMYEGQTVKSVNVYPESWNSKVILREVITW